MQLWLALVIELMASSTTTRTVIQPPNPSLQFFSSKTANYAAPSSPPCILSLPKHQRHPLFSSSVSAATTTTTPTTATTAIANTTQHQYQHQHQDQHPRPLLSSCPLNQPLSLSSNRDIDIDVDSFFDLLSLSVRHGNVLLARAIHASIIKLQEEQHTHLGNPLISAYLKLGLFCDAYDIFSGLSSPNVVSFTSLISGFAKSSREDEAIQLFFRMSGQGVEPNEHSFVAILTACSRILDLELGFQVHALIVKLGYLDSVFVVNALMGLYGKFSECLDYVLQLFVEMPHRDTVSWNTVIVSVVNGYRYNKAFELFFDMKRDNGSRVDFFTISTLLTACTGGFGLMQGQTVHAHAIRAGLEENLSVNNALIGFYTKCGSIKDVVALFERMPVRDIITWTEMITAYMEFGYVDLAVEIFDKMPEKNSVSYNALLAGFCKNGKAAEALDLFVKMVEQGLLLTDFTLTSAVNACGLLMQAKLSEQVHGFVTKFGSGSNSFIEAALLDMWTRCGTIVNAEKMFHRWPPEWDGSIIWTSMLCGYARNGQPERAISLFCHSQSEGIMVVDEVTLTSVLGVCGTLGFYQMGEQIHCLALKTGFLSDVGVANSIISMYSKCCNMTNAIKAFNVMPSHDIVSWNALIAGYLLHRQGDEALAVWSRMGNVGVKPDAVTFVLIIAAYKYTKSNSVDRCHEFVLSMKTIYDIEPTSEHYASLVGVLGYWGSLEEAEEIINKMPFEPEASVWRALLDSCRIHSKTTIGKRIARQILSMEPQDPCTYVLISNLYSASGRWHNSEMVREDMRKKGFRKHPSRSWIIHRNKVHSFYVRDKSHPQEKDVYSALEILILECLKAGYVPDTSFVLHEVEEHQKKDFLFYHSAKLAATYGLLMTRPGQPIQIVKNILVCGDCHSFLKYVSVITKREIFLRDASGFHHFLNGRCSCKDYW